METVNLSEQDNGTRIDVRIGAEIIFTLAENPTTGCRWQADVLTGEILANDGSTFKLESKTVGGGGKRIFRFRARGEGEIQLRLRNWQEWVGESSVSERFEATIRVIR